MYIDGCSKRVVKNAGIKKRNAASHVQGRPRGPKFGTPTFSCILNGLRTRNRGTVAVSLTGLFLLKGCSTAASRDSASAGIGLKTPGFPATVPRVNCVEYSGEYNDDRSLISYHRQSCVLCLTDSYHKYFAKVLIVHAVFLCTLHDSGRPNVRTESFLYYALRRMFLSLRQCIVRFLRAHAQWGHIRHVPLNAHGEAAW